MISTANPKKPFRIFVDIEANYCFPIRRYVDGIEILDEQIVYQDSTYLRVKRWLRGVHPNLGVITYGYTGWETVVEKDVIKSVNTFHVYESDINQLLLQAG